MKPTIGNMFATACFGLFCLLLAVGSVFTVSVKIQGVQMRYPIEVRSLSSVYGATRDADDPLWIGSVKTNLGHLESAAGMAGLFKVLLSLEEGWMPAHLHFSNPNPEIEWQDCGVRVCAEGRTWELAHDHFVCDDRRRVAMKGMGELEVWRLLRRKEDRAD